MRYFIYKTPREKGDRPLETHNSEPSQSLIEIKAMRFGPIVIVSEEQLKNEGEL